MSNRRKCEPGEMDLNLHYFSRSLVSRAKSRAASLGMTLKDWLTGVMERALGSEKAVDVGDTVPQEPKVGRRDL